MANNNSIFNFNVNGDSDSTGFDARHQLPPVLSGYYSSLNNDTYSDNLSDQHQHRQQQQQQEHQGPRLASVNDPPPLISDVQAQHGVLLGLAHQSNPLATSVIAPAVARVLNGGSSSKRARGDKKTMPSEAKDDRYFERRKRNNAAAKKSRDGRKNREDEIAVRASYLEKENAILRAQVTTLREEANSLRQLLLQRRSRP